MEFNGERFAYHGTGKELLKGYLTVFVAYIIFAILGKALLLVPVIGTILSIALPILFFVAFPWVLYSRRKYIASRTSWRGIRMGMEPKGKEFLGIYCIGLILTVLTLGIYKCHWDHEKYKFLTENTYLGTLRLKYTGNARDLLVTYIGGFFLSLLTFGLAYPWVLAKVWEYRARHTWIGNSQIGAAQGFSTIEGIHLLGLYLASILLISVTMGLALPWVITMTTRYMAGRIQFQGHVDMTAIAAVESKGDARMEGLAAVLDVPF